MGFVAFYKRFRVRAIFLCLVWILLFVVSMSSLELILDSFGQNAQVQSLVSLTWSGYVVASDFSSPKPEIIGVNASWTVPSVIFFLLNIYFSDCMGIVGHFNC
jgi:hypothetical protein